LPADIAKDFGVARQVVLYHARKAGTFRPPGGCGYKAKELAPEKSTGQCPKCGAPLWATAVPLDFTLKHLRSTFGSYVVESAGGLRAAQLFLRHRDHQTTDAHYAERRDPYLQAQMAQVRILPADRLPTAGGSFLSERARLSSTSSENQSQLPVLDHRGAQSP
jgi:hypothetical protein